MIFLRSLVFAICMWLSVVVFAPLALLTFPLSLERRYRFISQWARFNLWLLRAVSITGSKAGTAFPRGRR
jgi:1-acyl-sn-glycerol-3-phosphate acyltransferase